MGKIYEFIYEPANNSEKILTSCSILLPLLVINCIILLLRIVLHKYLNSLYPSFSGVINGTAPNPVRLAEMCEQLGKVLGRPSWLPVPDFALKAVLGEGASVV